MDNPGGTMNRFESEPEMVIPLILPKLLDESDVLTCRLVSKPWKMAIDQALLFHPDRLPYKSDAIYTLTEKHFQFFSYPKLTTSFDKVIKSGYTGDTNPFIGRYVEIYVGDEDDKFKSLLEAIPPLEMFGRHIHYVRFYLKKCGDQEIQMLYKCLAHLKSIKSFWMEVKLDSKRKQANYSLPEAATNTVKFEGQLDTLDLSQLNKVDKDVHTELLTLLANHNNIKKLGVNLEYWQESFGELFPNLVELYISGNVYWFTGGMHQIKETLTQLRAPLLKRLRIMNFRLNLVGLLTYLAESPHNLESLELVGLKMWEEIHDYPDRFTLPTILDLKMIISPHVHFKFLENLPGLQRISLHWDLASWPCTKYRVSSQTNFAASLRRFYYDARYGADNFADVWDELPHLQELTVYWQDGISRQYVREEKDKVYETCKNRSRHDFEY